MSVTDIRRSAIDPERNGRRRSYAGLFLGVIFCAGILIPDLDPAARETNLNAFRVGFSSVVFRDVNENDAMASLKVWAPELAKILDIPVDPIPQILTDENEIRQALRNNRIDAITLPTDQYLNLRDEINAKYFIAARTDGRVDEEYILLTHPESGIHALTDLRGRKILLWRNIHMFLAPIWLDMILVENGFSCGTVNDHVTQSTNLSHVVLPVFFRTAEACVVNRSGFEIVCDLNPQIRQQLRVIASSRAIIPSVFAFRRDIDDSIQKKVVTQLTKIETAGAGKQIFTLFQIDSLEIQPISRLDSTIELLDAHRRLCARAGRMPAGKAQQEKHGSGQREQ